MADYTELDAAFESIRASVVKADRIERRLQLRMNLAASLVAIVVEVASGIRKQLAKLEATHDDDAIPG